MTLKRLFLHRPIDDYCFGVFLLSGATALIGGFTQHLGVLLIAAVVNGVSLMGLLWVSLKDR